MRPGLLLLIFFSLGILPAFADPPSTPAATSAGAASSAMLPAAVNVQLKNAVAESEKKLGNLEPWQKKIFDEEIVTQHQRFIRDYRAGTGVTGGMTIEVDTDSIRKYLNFYAPRTLPKSDIDGKILVLLRAEPGCTKCIEGAEDVKSLVRARLERRGYTLVWLSPEELGDLRLSGKLLTDRVTEAAVKRNISSVLVVEWQVAPIDDIDTAHADERKYLIRSFLSARDFHKTDGRMELFDADTFSSATARLITDAFTEFGAHAQDVQLAQAAEREETNLEITGIQDFASYAKLKSQLQAQFKDFAVLEERKLSRGKVTFAVLTNKSVEDVKAMVQSTSLEAGKLFVTNTQDRLIQTELK